MQTNDSIEPKTNTLHSRLKHNMPLTLGSEQSVMLYKRYFTRADNALYMSTKVLRFQRRSEEAQKNASLIDALILQFLSEIENTTSTLNQAYLSSALPGATLLPTKTMFSSRPHAVRTIL